MDSRRTMNRSSRSGRAASPSRNRTRSPPMTILRGGPGTGRRSPPPQQPARPKTPTRPRAKADEPLEMDKRIKLISGSMNFCLDKITAIPSTRPCKVIGCLGGEGVGKSTIMSMIYDENAIAEPSKLETDDPGSFFPVQSLVETLSQGKHKTCGVDMCLKSGNVVLLDCQPVLSGAILADLTHKEHSQRFLSAWPAEELEALQSLMLTVFLMEVCDVLVVVQDSFQDLEMLRFLRTAEMLYCHTMSVNGMDARIHAAQAVFVINKVTENSIENYKKLLMTYLEAPMCMNKIIDPPVVFTLPLRQSTTTFGQDFPEAMQCLRQSVYNLRENAKIKKQNVPFREWLKNASQVFDLIKTSMPIASYGRIMQRIRKESV